VLISKVGTGTRFDMNKLSRFIVVGTTVVNQETNEIVAVCDTVDQAKITWFNLTYPEAA
jgi:hypothetical protein